VSTREKASLVGFFAALGFLLGATALNLALAVVFGMAVVTLVMGGHRG
jgi:hypothetical protein